MSVDLVSEIERLKKERNAVILAHNYQVGEVQDVADMVGDSLGLSREAAETDADVIVFCGVYFMAETAKILSPEKTVLIPDPNARCNMAAMIDVEGLRALKAKHPSAQVVCYVNTTADIKAECDACCTSANAVDVVEGLDADEIIFVPDKYLCAFVEKQLKERGVKKKMIPWQGFCPTHLRIIPNYLKALKEKHPGARIITHPECTPDTNRLADAVLSTSKMSKFAAESDAKEIIVGTEVGMLHRLQTDNPGKKFTSATELAVCPNMKLITLQKVYESLRDMKFEVEVEEEIAKKATKAIDRMMEFTG
ncbi:quinolinate synthase NadA [Candidatus Peregrinibacteria bacterium]|jgi:quinolinate synthase|nr:quinolinate synthase NadA [Candidatus Peregrinibacteria bacterium]MBT4148710.1 quinolinate synthase NadA [Candidatus Peregrinibacteria bacterium]MBT4366155.1 quinolinate synthase NadA [Candidatus Peregrinibacteria bacterium]MBT4456291.1 quinolinate synthase NadA [Candidatus Peregrinibacteria bacterium]